MEPSAAGDAVPRGYRTIEVRLTELRQLFNAIDPSPFRERDLDPGAEAFIVGWARDLPAHSLLALVVHLDRAAGRSDEAAVLREAIHKFFSQKAASTRSGLRQLFGRGRVSLAIGLTVVALSIGIGDALSSYFPGNGLSEIFRESLLIGGWVAMWRPLEIFLYDWWPIRRDVRLFDRLSAMPVRIEYIHSNSTDAWRRDWPEKPVGAKG